jgi:hypothetical protein
VSLLSNAEKLFVFSKIVPVQLEDDNLDEENFELHINEEEEQNPVD